MRNVTTWLAIVTWVGVVPAGAQLGPDRNLTLFQADLGAVDEGGDRFGDALVACDFDGDTFLDLAIGVPDEDVGAIVDAGSVLVTHGSFAARLRRKTTASSLNQPPISATARGSPSRKRSIRSRSAASISRSPPRHEGPSRPSRA